MIIGYYRSPFVQKGYGLGSIFRGVAKRNRPIARKIANTLKSPEVRNVCKKVGKEALGNGSKLLMDSLKDNYIESKLDNRIKLAKKRIVNSIEDGISMRKRTKGKQKYHRINDDESDEFFFNIKRI